MGRTAGNRHALIVGASRGIGLALVRQLLADESYGRIYASYRNKNRAAGLLSITDPRLRTLPLDVSNDLSLEAFSRQLESARLRPELVIHAAGILHEDAVQPEKSVEQCEPRRLMRMFEVNSIGPLMVARAVLPRMKRSDRFSFAVLSAMVGSIGDNRLGGWYGYRASKAALNQFTRTLAVECRRRFPGATVTAIHPGTTDTDLSKPFQGNVRPGKLYTPGQTAQRILGVIRQAEGNGSGSFYNWDGTAIPW